MKTIRTQRLGGEYQRAVSTIIATKLKEKTDDVKGIVSITKADISPDLKNAKLFVSIYSTRAEESEKTFHTLEQYAPFIRKELAAMMKMRTVPELRFIKDTTFEYGAKIDNLIDSLHNHKV